MFLFDVDEKHRELLLRAMKTVVVADRETTDNEQVLLEVVAAALGVRCSPELDALDENEPTLDELGSVERTRLVQSMILMAIMDGHGARREAEVVERFASRLGVDDARVSNLRELAEGRIRYMRFDLTRRGYARDELVRTAKEEGVRGVYKTFGPLLGLAQDPAVARKYIQLGELPIGTVGRGYFDLITKNDLSFPGEAGGLAERGMWHDMLHVIGGYPVDPVGEAEVVAFMAGFRKDDPFFWLFTAALQFQVGLVISPFAPGVANQIDPQRYVLHHRRGALVNTDLTTDWRFDEDWAWPLDEVRRRYNVLPLSAIQIDSRA